MNSFGIDFFPSIDGNYEFTKSQFLIFLSSILFFLFGIQNLKEKRKIVFPKEALFLLGIFAVSTYFSISTYTSFFGLDSKGHGSLLYLCLLGIYIILIQQKKEDIKHLFFASLTGATLVSIIAIREYLFPSFGYGELSNRALGTFGHPNLLVLFLLLLAPYILHIAKQNKIHYLLLFVVSIVIFLTKSIWGILIFLTYICYYFFSQKSLKIYYKKTFIIIAGCLLGYIIFHFGFYTKLHSFLSRFYIWESVLQIIIDNPKVLLFGSGPDTLLAYFDIYKSPELYIFENPGFHADRPHNFFFNIFFHFGIGGFVLLGYLLKQFYKNYKNNYTFHIIILFFCFTFFNFASIASYLFLILVISYISNKKKEQYIPFILPIVSIVLAGIGFFSSTAYYISESKSHLGEYKMATKIFPYNYRNYEAIGDLKSIYKYAGYQTNYSFVDQLQSGGDIFQICEIFTQTRKSAESHFYCGNVLWNRNQKQQAKIYYKKGLAIVPDLWDNTSDYHTDFFIAQFVDGKRFFSQRYWNLSEILERVGYENNFTKE